jgi:hypothetical protein
MRLVPGICGSSLWVRVILSPRRGLSVSRFPTACAVGCILTPLRG